MSAALSTMSQHCGLGNACVPKGDHPMTIQQILKAWAVYELQAYGLKPKPITLPKITKH